MMWYDIIHKRKAVNLKLTMCQERLLLLKTLWQDKSSKTYFILIGICVHLVFLISIFDVYFNSPVLHGIEVYQPKFEPAADRLVLFVADGLRARSFFAQNMTYSPYMRHVIETKGSWGLSHTRVPTESRPGHVALIAGLYEDPSAVTKGWTENPVEFDSVFNRSSHTWAWGSPDILPMFAKGEAAGKVTTHCYSSKMQKFSGDGSNERLDNWVLERVVAFFSQMNAETEGLLRKKGVIIFAHLLGIDTTGHATKPRSSEYKNNIRLVDRGIEQVETAVENFFGHDGRTAYVYTADHGMSDWGSHGAGSTDETETPLVAWGAGVRGPLPMDEVSPLSPEDWGLGALRRRDVMQADIAALMSALLALPTPTNNVGVLPIDYLAKDASWITQAMLSNALQMEAQLETAKDKVHSRLFPVFLRPYPGLESLDLSEAQNLAERGQHKAAQAGIREVIVRSLEGLLYYQEYFGCGLKWAISAAHVCWLAYLAKNLLPEDGEASPESYGNLLAVFPLCVLVTIFLVLAQDLPLQYTVYYSLPLLLLWATFKDASSWLPRLARAVTWGGTLRLAMVAVATLVVVLLLVLAFFQREILSVGLLLVGIWPLGERAARGRNSNLGLCAAWLSCCLVLLAFPMLPVVGRAANYNLVLCSGLVSSMVGVAAILVLRPCFRLDLVALSTQVVLLASSSVNVYWTSLRFEEGRGLTLANQVTSWIILGLSCLLPALVRSRTEVRLLSLWLAISAVLELLSVAHEPVFLLLLLAVLSLYPLLEMDLASMASLELNAKSCGPSEKESVNIADLRRAFFYLFFTVLAFFGTGNVASVNSFDPSWVRCFVTTFSPRLMGALILMKTGLPFLAVALGVRTSAEFIQRPVQWLLLLCLTNVMALAFFNLVKTTGSWLEIGESISHFVICHVCVLLLLLLYWVAEFALISGVEEEVCAPPSLETPSIVKVDNLKHHNE